MADEPEAGDYTLVDQDVARMSLQVGFVEGMVREERSMRTLADALRHAFRNNREYAVLLWSGVPVPLNYPGDVAPMMGPVVDLLSWVRDGKSDATIFEVHTDRCDFEWAVTRDGNVLELQARWQRAPGQMEALLNRFSFVRMEAEAFCCEWKLLLEQVLRALVDTKLSIVLHADRKRLKQLAELNLGIRSRGVLYRHDQGAS